MLPNRLVERPSSYPCITACFSPIGLDGSFATAMYLLLVHFTFRVVLGIMKRGPEQSEPFIPILVFL